MLRVAAACLAVVGAMALSACSDDAPVVPAPSPSSSSSTEAPAPTPTLTPPPVPPEVGERTPEGAEAFVPYFFDVLAYAYASGDTAELEARSAPECKSCVAYIAEIEDRYAADGSFEGVQVDILNADSAPVEERGFLVSVGYYEHASRALSASGAVEKETSAFGPARLVFAADWTDAGWVAFGIGSEE